MYTAALTSSAPKLKTISRRSFLAATAAGGLALGQSAGRAEKRPSFLVILTDDQTHRAIGYDNPLMKTPHIDALAMQGTIFDRAYVATPICAASRASMMTGQYPQQHGCIALDSSSFISRFGGAGPGVTLPQLLSVHGYQTALYGKSHLGPPTAYGFAEGEELRDPEAFQAAHDFLGRVARTEAPFLLWLSTHAPHIPLDAEEEWLDLYDVPEMPVDPNFRESPTDASINNQGVPGEHFYRDSGYREKHGNASAGPPRDREEIQRFTKAYYAMISRLDHQIGELIAQLKATGAYDNTVIVFLSDNGYHLGNHGLGNKITMHEESVRIPMFIADPRSPRGGQRCGELVSSLDVFSTLLDFAGLPPHTRAMGQSLAPLLRGEAGDFRPYVPSECVGVDGKPGEGHRMVRTKRWKYVLSGTDEESLFDELNDPFELHSLADNAQHQETLSALRANMNAWMIRIGDTHKRPPG